MLLLNISLLIASFAGIAVALLVTYAFDPLWLALAAGIATFAAVSVLMAMCCKTFERTPEAGELGRRARH